MKYTDLEEPHKSLALDAESARSKYHKEVKGVFIDVYDVLHAFNVESHAIGHAVKKLLMAGQRGHKSYYQDLNEAIQSIERAGGCD